MRSAIAGCILGVGVFAQGAMASWWQDPGFESGILTTGWFSAEAQVTFVDQSTEPISAQSGTKMVKVATTNDTTAYWESPNSPSDVPEYVLQDYLYGETIPGGATYTVSAWYYLETSLREEERIGISVIGLKVNGAGTAFEPSSDWVSPFNPAFDPDLNYTTVFGATTNRTGTSGFETVGVWTEITHTYTAPADADYLQLSLRNRGTGSTVYWDNVTVVPEPATLVLVGLGLATMAGTVSRRGRNRNGRLSRHPSERFG